MECKKILFDKKSIEDTIRKEYKFVTNLLSILPIPDSAQKDDDSENENDRKRLAKLVENKTTRAKSLSELQARLDAIKKTKKKMSYKDKLLQKGVKNRLKKKSRQDEKNAKKKINRAVKLESIETKSDIKENGTSIPIFNSEDKMVFSKIDFSNLGHKKEKKGEKDPKKLLKGLEKQKEKIEQLEAVGEKDKAIEIKEKTAWKSALSKAQGEKVKDDPTLLKKSVKKLKQQKNASKRKWEKRIDNVNKQKEERQNKRTENIQKRKKDKKLNKLKKAAKKGKIIPGF